MQFFLPIQLPNEYEIYDFSGKYNPHRKLQFPFGIGRYGEKRPDMYRGELYEVNQRNIHMGLDFGAPIGTEVKSFFKGEIFDFVYHATPFDYGYTLILKHEWKGQKLYSLYGHLSEGSIKEKEKGIKVNAGEVIAWVGNSQENGGWNPHLHFQLSLKEPSHCDMPGVVSEEEWPQAQLIYPDPRIFLGPLYL